MSIYTGWIYIFIDAMKDNQYKVGMTRSDVSDRFRPGRSFNTSLGIVVGYEIHLPCNVKIYDVEQDIHLMLEERYTTRVFNLYDEDERDKTEWFVGDPRDGKLYVEEILEELGYKITYSDSVFFSSIKSVRRHSDIDLLQLV